MLGTTPIVSEAGVSVTLYACDGGHAGWSCEEEADEFALVLVRSGVFRRRVEGSESLATPMAGYIERPGSVYQVAHPHGGDVCTSIGLSQEAIDSMVGPLKLAAIHVEPADDLAHRLLLRRARRGAEQNELVERALMLAGRALAPNAARSQFSTAGAACSRIADQVREALSENPQLTLSDLGVLVGRSMYYVSRAFKAASGMSVTQYRLKVRSVLAMRLMEDGAAGLAQVAFECGFADQSHMTRTVRGEIAITPGRLMKELQD